MNAQLLQSCIPSQSEKYIPIICHREFCIPPYAKLNKEVVPSLLKGVFCVDTIYIP